MRGLDGVVADGVVPPAGTGGPDANVDPVAHPPATPTTLIAEFTIDHADLVLTPTMAARPSVTVEPDGPTTGSPGIEYLFFTATGEDLDGFKDAVADDHTVDDVTVVGRFDDHRVYRAIVADGAITVSSILSALAVRVLAIESAGESWWLRVQLPDRNTLVDFRELCLERGVDFSVRKLVEPDGEGVDSRVGLRDHERETLLAAFASGYFDVPRAVSQKELADQLDISPSAISQRLRTAVGRLLEETIAGE